MHDEPLIADLDFADLMPDAPFSELHHREVAHDLDTVWPHCLAVTAGEVRAIGPLFAVRVLPRRLLQRKRPPTLRPTATLLESFVDENFVLLRRDEEPRDDRGVVIFGAAGRFWSPVHNPPIHFGGPHDFIEFSDPGYAKTVARLEAVRLPGGGTRIETETLVVGTDPASTKKFAPYWAVIRLPSGLIRRSWLAAIERRLPPT